MNRPRPPPAQGPPGSELKWFYLGDDGKTIGPFPLAQMQAWFIAKYFSERVHVRSEKMEKFVPITQTPCTPRPVPRIPGPPQMPAASPSPGLMRGPFAPNPAAMAPPQPSPQPNTNPGVAAPPLPNEAGVTEPKRKTRFGPVSFAAPKQPQVPEPPSA